MTQMNVRMPRELKNRGDDALEAMGLSASQVVRRVYELAIRYEREPRTFINLLSLESSDEHAAFLRRMKAFQEGPLIIERARKQLGLPAEPGPEMRRILSLPWKEMREALDDLPDTDVPEGAHPLTGEYGADSSLPEGIRGSHV